MNEVFRPVGVFQEPLMHVLVYATKYEVAYSLARFQEFYENVALRGTIFTRQQLQDQQPLYYNSWSGFNFPASVPAHFMEHHHEWKTDIHENAALARMVKAPYIVGSFLSPDLVGMMKHERCHAAWDADKEFKEACMDYMQSWEYVQLVRDVLTKMGYGENVLWDETQAYACHGWEKLHIPFVAPMALVRFQKAYFENKHGIVI